MKIKNLAMILLAGLVCAGTASAKRMSDLKVYINPGHGGYTSNDRPIHLYPFPTSTDTLGYWESKSNLYKGLHMYHILDSLGCKAYLSRIKNTEDDDRSLSGIAAEANALGVDFFISIHSNAGENVNTPLMLYRENTIGTPRYPENVTVSKIIWQNLHSNQLPIWTRTSEYVVGDLTFYQNMWQGGLGVLRTLYTVGLLSEGSMHEHRPEAYRLMNDDYWWLEAWHFVKSIMEFYNTEDRFVTGNVAGIVYDDHNRREMDMPVNFTRFGRDYNAPVNGMLVELMDKNGNVVQKRTTDDMYNGVYVFRNVAPGDYTVRTTKDNYYTRTTDVTVKAAEVSYCDMPVSMRREEPLKILTYSPNVAADETVSCASTIDFTFNFDIDEEAWEKAVTITPAVDGYWEYLDNWHTAKYIPSVSLERETAYTVHVDKSACSPDRVYEHPNMEADLEFSFTTRGRNRLELIDQFPAAGDKLHYASPSFEFRFDMTIDAGNIYDQIAVTDSKGQKVSINKRSSKSNQLSNNYGNAVLVVQGNLNEGETYHVKLDGELRDRENLPIGQDIEFDFVAEDVTKDFDPENKVYVDFETASDFAYDKEQTTGIGNVLPTATRSTADKFIGKASGKFGYQFTSTHGGEIVWNYNGPADHFNGNDMLGMYVKGDFNNHELWVTLSSGTSKKYYKVCDLDYLGWRYQEVKLSDLQQDMCPYVLSEIKLVQVESPITQKGQFILDDICQRTSSDSYYNGVSDITVDGNTVSVNAVSGGIAISGAQPDAKVTITALDGRTIATAIGNGTISVATGAYVVAVDGKACKISVK